MFSVASKIWNAIPEHDNIYNTIRPLHVYSQIHGLACYRTVTKRGLKSYSVNGFTILRNTLQILLFAGIIIQSYFTEPRFGDNQEISMKLEYVQDLVASFLAIIQLVLGMAFSSKIVRIFKNVDEVDKKIKSLAIHIPYKYTFVYAIVSVVVVSTVLLIILMIATYAYIDEHNIFYILLQSVAYSIPYSVNGIVEFQYVHYTSILRRRYQLLNEYLEAILNEKPVSDMNEWAHKTNKINTTYNTKPNKASENALFTVNTVAALHIKLTDTSVLVCHAYCVQLLFLITISFVGLVIALFFIAVNFSKPPDSESAGLNFIFTTWAFMNALQLMSVVYVTCTLCEEANRCPRILHKIRNHTNDTPLHDTIETYSLQMYHNRLQFHVCGLFPLDYTLLYTIVAGVTTYLVILIQFNNTNTTGRGNFTNAGNNTRL